MKRWVLFLIVAYLLAAGCSDSTFDADNAVLVNGRHPDNVNPTVAGEYFEDPSELPADYSAGVLTLENVSDTQITLTGAWVVDSFGDIEVVEAAIAGHDRDVLWSSSATGYPPQTEYYKDSLVPLEGFVLNPNPEGQFPTANVVLHLRVGPKASVSGYRTVCVSLESAGHTGEVCADHGFNVCERNPENDCPRSPLY